jgi:uncharacterized glyoxalase superfamily protein PhnB
MGEFKGGVVSPSLTCDDLAASIDWYTKVLGFEEGERWEHEGVLMGMSLRFGGVDWYLSQDDWKKGRDRQKGVGFRLHVQVEGDLDAMAAGIESRGGKLDAGPQDQSWGVRDFSVTDPTGFKLTFAKEQ